MFETMGSSLLMSKGKAASGPLVTCTLWWHVDMWLSLEAINKVRDREPVCRRILGQPSSRGGPRSRHHWFCWGLLLCPAVLPSCHHPCVCVSPSLSAPCKKSSVEACSLWPFSLSVLTVCFAAFCRKFSFGAICSGTVQQQVWGDGQTTRSEEPAAKHDHPLHLHCIQGVRTSRWQRRRTQLLIHPMD